MTRMAKGIRSGCAAMVAAWALGLCACDSGEPYPSRESDEPLATGSQHIDASTDSSETTVEEDPSDTVESTVASVPETDSDTETVEAVEEPPLPPALSFFYSQQAQGLQARRQVCGLVGLDPAAVPPGLVEHLTTRDEYAHHQTCMASLAELPCESRALIDGDLTAVGDCLYHEAMVYDPLEPPAECPFSVDAFTLDVRRQRFSLNNAYYLLELSILSKLETSEEAMAELEPLGYLKASITTKNRMQVLFAEHHDYVVLAFKGTTGFSDYFSNATYMMLDKTTTGLPGKVHKGFYDTLDSGWTALVPVIEAAFATGKPVVFTGHSLGGAVAQLAAFKAYLKKGLVARSVYMFATPRVGNQTYADAYMAALGDRSFRVSNGMDMTPHVPPAAGSEQVAKEALLSLFGEGGLGLDVLSGILDFALELADYTQVGDEIWIDPQGYLYGLLEDDVKADNAYWTAAAAMFADWSFSEITDALPVFHDDRTHLCYQARFIDQLLYERD